MATIKSTSLLGLVSNSARLIELNASPGAGPADNYVLTFFDYADLTGIQARVHFKSIDPYLQIWLIEYEGPVPGGNPIALPQHPDEPLSIDGVPVGTLASIPAMVMFADDYPPDAEVSLLRCCPHPPPLSPPAPAPQGPHAIGDFDVCSATFKISGPSNPVWYEVRPA